MHGLARREGSERVGLNSWLKFNQSDLLLAVADDLLLAVADDLLLAVADDILPPSLTHLLPRTQATTWLCPSSS